MPSENNPSIISTTVSISIIAFAGSLLSILACGNLIFDTLNQLLENQSVKWTLLKSIAVGAVVYGVSFVVSVVIRVEGVNVLGPFVTLNGFQSDFNSFILLTTIMIYWPLVVTVALTSVLKRIF